MILHSEMRKINANARKIISIKFYKNNRIYEKKNVLLTTLYRHIRIQ